MDNSVEKITFHSFQELVKNSHPIIIDVRSSDEFNEKNIPNSINIPLDLLADRISSTVENKDQFIIVYCKSGKRSEQATLTLKELGYINIKDFGGISNYPT